MLNVCGHHLIGDNMRLRSAYICWISDFNAVKVKKIYKSKTNSHLKILSQYFQGCTGTSTKMDLHDEIEEIRTSGILFNQTSSKSISRLVIYFI